MDDKLKKRMLQAKQLIEAQRYDEAKALLVTIDHPTAEKWLDKLIKITATAQTPVPAATIGPAPAVLEKVKVEEKSQLSPRTGCLAFVVMVLVCMATLGAFTGNNQSPLSPTPFAPISSDELSNLISDNVTHTRIRGARYNGTGDDKELYLSWYVPSADVEAISEDMLMLACAVRDSDLVAGYYNFVAWLNDDVYIIVVGITSDEMRGLLCNYPLEAQIEDFEVKE